MTWLPTQDSLVEVGPDMIFDAASRLDRQVRQPAVLMLRLVVEALAPEGHFENAPARALLHADIRDLALVRHRDHVVRQAVEELLEGTCTEK